MESNMIECPVDEEWKFHKADLLTLKETESGYLNGKSFYAYNIPGVMYYLSVYPFGSENEKYRGKTGIYLFVNGSEEKIISASFVISIKSANYISHCMEHIYQTTEGWGIPLTESEEFFDSNKKFFLNGEITIGIKGILKVARPTAVKIASPISMQWKIKESDLIGFKESNNGFLRSKKFPASSLFNVNYYLEIYPNGNKAENHGKAIIFLQIVNEQEKRIEAVCDVSIISAKFCHNLQHVYETSEGYGCFYCSTNDLFDPSKNFIVNGFLTLNLNGILMIDDYRITTLLLTKSLATVKDFLEMGKDFTIVIGEKEIKVHKKLLVEASPVFAGMFESGMKGAIENKMKIPDFSFEIVDAAITLCYGSYVFRKFSTGDILLIYKFADKYDIKIIMDYMEDYLITKKLSPANVCQFIQFAESLNAEKLYQKSVEFLMKCSKEGTPVYGTNALDKDLVFSMFLSSLSPTAETDN